MLTPSTACSAHAESGAGDTPTAAMNASPSLNARRFSNHTGYPAVRGERLGAPQLEALLEGLRLNGLLAGAYSHLLSGYVGAAPVLLALAKAAAELTQLNPGLGTHSALAPPLSPRSHTAPPSRTLLCVGPRSVAHLHSLSRARAHLVRAPSLTPPSLPPPSRDGQSSCATP